MSDYQQFLRSGSETVAYTLGADRGEQRLLFEVEGNELWLTPGQARRLSASLLAAAWYIERKQVTA